MNTKSHRTLRTIADTLMRTIVCSLIIFGSISLFSPTSYTLDANKVYASTNCATATVPQAQCQALVDIYNQMGGTNRDPAYTQGTGNTNLGGPSSGWLANDDPCSWHGVTCDTSTPKNVIGIQFAGYKVATNQLLCAEFNPNKAGLVGSFPSSISNLSQLKTFNPSHNTGVSQASLQSLSLPNTLTHYCAYIMGLTGLGATQFAGLTNLQDLRLSSNAITSLSPTQFVGLTNLQILNLGGNIINSLSANQFSGLTNLWYLDLQNNQIDSLSATQFAGLTNLEDLFLGNNIINSLSANQFSGLTNLQDIYLYNNQISSLSPTQFAGLSNLQDLDISHNQITSLSPTQFYGLTNLQNLNFTNLKKSVPYYTGAIPSTYSGLNFTTNPTWTRQLYVRGNGGIPNTICGQQPTWIQIARDMYFSGNQGNTDIDDLSRFGGTTQVNTCPLGASCNTTADCASGLSCLASGANFTCQTSGGGSGGGGSGNQSPTITLTSPINGATFTAPATVAFSGSATDPDGTIASVQFRQGTTVLFTDTTSPYSYTRTGVGAGTYSLTAIATDNSGASTTSTTATITVTNPTYTLTGTLGSSGANASVNVCGTTVTANGSGTFSRTGIPQGSNCSTIAASKPGFVCTFTTQGPSSIVSNISNVVGSCTTGIPATYTLTGTLGSNGANASVNVCGTTVTANSSGVFSRTPIAHGSNCSAISATKAGYTCTITTQGPNSLVSNISNVLGSCTQNSSGGGGGGGASSIGKSTTPTTTNPLTPTIPAVLTSTTPIIQTRPATPVNQTGITRFSTKKLTTMSDATIKKHSKTLYNAYIRSYIKEGETIQNKKIKKFIILLNLYMHHR